MAAAMTLSGTLGVFVLESGQSAWNVVFFRCLFGALSLLAYCWARGLLRPAVHAPHAGPGAGGWRRAGAELGAAVLGLPAGLDLAGHGGHNVQPFFLIGLGVLFLGERPSAGKLAWSVVAFAGLLLVLRLWDARADGGDYLAGLALGLGAAALYGVTAVIIKRLKAIPPQVLALTQVTLGAVMLLPMADFSALPASPLQWSYLVALGWSIPA